MLTRRADHLVANIRHLLRCDRFETKRFLTFVIGPAHRSDISAVSQLYESLNCVPLSTALHFILMMGAPRTCLVIRENAHLIGMNLFYVNKVDVEQNTVHEGFVGVKPEYVGRGLATEMRNTARLHFEQAGYSGITSRVDVENHSSYYSALKCGFEVQYEYQDDVTGRLRAYMTAKL